MFKRKSKIKRPHAITVTNDKGGVGKTTFCVNLAGVLLERGAKVLLVDLDKQINLTSLWPPEDYNPDKPCGVTALLMRDADPNDLIYETPVPNLFLLPGDRKIKTVEIMLWGDDEAYTLLADKIDGLSGFDYILFDTPHDFGLLTQMALVASDSYLVPIEPQGFSYQGLQVMRRKADSVLKDLNTELRSLGYVLNKVDDSRATAGTIEQFAKRLGKDLVATQIKYSPYYMSSIEHGLPVTHWKRTKNRPVSKAFRQLVDDLSL